MRSRNIAVAATLVALGFALPASAHEAGQWIVRGGAGTVSPDDKNYSLGSSELEDGTVVLDTYLEVDDGSSVVLNATYMFNEYWGIDILGALPFKHDVDIVGVLEGSPVAIPIGDVKHLPPTVSLQYHFAPDATIQPYAGVGLNYTTFFSESVTQDAVAIGLVGFEVKDSYGFAAQLGADLVFGEKWLINFDARYVQIHSKLNVTVDVGDGPVTVEFPGYMDINPFVYSVSVGYRF